MMSRAQRIEYEILDCALNRAADSEGFTTTVNAFMKRLERIFPDIKAGEFRQTCKRMAGLDGIEVGFPGIDGYQYLGADDDKKFFDAKTIRLSLASESRAHFQKLTALIDVPGYTGELGHRS